MTDQHLETDTGNSVIRTMREQLDAANRAASEAQESRAALESRLREVETARQSEAQRLTTEVETARRESEDAARLREEHGKLSSTLERLYHERLEQIPESKRAAVEGLSQAGSWAERLDALQDAVALIGAGPPPALAGTITQPAYPVPGTFRADSMIPLTPETHHKISFMDALKARVRRQRGAA